MIRAYRLDVDPVQRAGAVQTSALVAGGIDYRIGIAVGSSPQRLPCPFKGITVTHARTLFWLIGSPC